MSKGTPAARTLKIDSKKSVVIVPSKSVRSISSRGGGAGGGAAGLEETEIAAHVSVPQDGGWGWIVVASAFFSIGILDGIVFTFGSLLSDMAQDLKQREAMVALVNSVGVAVYFLAGPLVSALINRFGFRACAMSGSVISSMSFFCTYFSKSLHAVCLFYGFIGGMGFSLINMSCGLIVGFYFERHRALALAIATTGSGVGVIAFSALNTYLVQIGGWRTTTLLHSGLLGIIFFLSMSFRPLVEVAVTKAEDPTRTVTFLPTISAQPGRIPSETTQVAPTAAERLFGAVSNVNYPTGAAVVEEANATTPSAGPSMPRPSALALAAYKPEGGVDRLTMNHVRSMTSRSRYRLDSTESRISTSVTQNRKKGRWARLFRWEPHIRQARPMYRDDAFYHGRVTKLPEYEKSMLGPSDEPRSGLEYRLAVSRAAATSDLHERRGVCTTAVRRVLATMLDPALLRRPSYLLLCLSGFSAYMGFLVPYVYLQDRNRQKGLPEEHCAIFISIVGLANSMGRLILGLMANKINPSTLSWITQIMAGVATSASTISYSIEFQYAYCCVFGFCIASVACLRSILIVSLYGLDKLTNGFGVVIMFQGLGSLFSTPLAGFVIETFGYTAGFVVAGSFILFSGIVLIPARSLAGRENKNLANT